MNHQVAPAAARPVVVARVVGAHGVRGSVRVVSYCDTPEAFDQFPTLRAQTRDGQTRDLGLRNWRASAKGLLLDLEGISDRDAAEALTGAELCVDRELLPPLPPGQYYWTDLEGMQVLGGDGIELGTVSHLFESGAHPTMAVQDGQRQRLIPFVLDRVVQTVDLQARRIQVDWDPDF